MCFDLNIGVSSFDSGWAASDFVGSLQNTIGGLGVCLRLRRRQDALLHVVAWKERPKIAAWKVVVGKLHWPPTDSGS